MVEHQFDFDALQREVEARQLGADMYRQAAEISPQTVEALAAVLTALAQRTKGRLIGELADEYAREMMADSARTHYEHIAGTKKRG